MTDKSETSSDVMVRERMASIVELAQNVTLEAIFK